MNLDTDLLSPEQAIEATVAAYKEKEAKYIPSLNGTIVENTLEIQTYLDTNIKVYIPKSKTVTLNNIVMGEFSTLEVDGHIILNAGETDCITISNKNAVLKGGGVIDGGNTSTFKVSTATEGTRTGVKIYNSDATLINKTKINGLTIKGFDKGGVIVSNTNSMSTYEESVSISEVAVTNCYRGFYFDDKGEYSSASLISASDCYIGFDIKGGNNKIVCSNSTKNYINLNLQDGTNEGHGIINGCAFNHAVSGGKGLVATSVAYGMVINACMFWYADISITNSYGISIQNGQLANINIYVSGGGPGIIANNTLFGTVTRTFNAFANIKWSGNKYMNNSSDSSLFNLYREFYVKATGYAGTTNLKGSANQVVFKTNEESKRHGFQDAVNTLISNSKPFFSVAGTMDFDVQLSVKPHTGALDQFVTVKIVIYTSSAMTTVYDTIEASHFLPATSSYIVVKTNGTAKVLYGHLARVEVTTTDVANGIDIEDTASTRIKVQSYD